MLNCVFVEEDIKEELGELRFWSVSLIHSFLSNLAVLFYVLDLPNPTIFMVI